PDFAVDVLGLLAADIEGADPLFDLRDLAERLLAIGDRLAQPRDVRAVLLELREHAATIGLEHRDLVGDELIDDRKLGPRADRDVLDLVLAVEIRRKHLPARERDLDRRAALVGHLGLARAAPVDPVLHAIAGLDRDLDGPAIEVGLDQLGQLRLADRVGALQLPEGVAAQLEDRGLAGPARADDAVEAGGEVHLEVVPEPTEHGETPDLVGRAQHVFLGRGVGHRAGGYRRRRPASTGFSLGLLRPTGWADAGLDAFSGDPAHSKVEDPPTETPRSPPATS